MFNPDAFKQLINLRFFYSQEGNLVAVALLDEEIELQIVKRNTERAPIENTIHAYSNWLGVGHDPSGNQY